MAPVSVLDSPAQATAAAATPRSLDHLLGLEIPVTVCFGQREIALRDLATLAAGSILELDRGAQAPVDIMVNSRVVARGELLVVDEQYALRITEVGTTGDRIRSLGR